MTSRPESPAASFQIVSVTAPESMSHVHRLFVEYANWLGFDLCFQGFDQELSALPGKYAPPRGRILFALVDGGRTRQADHPIEQPGVPAIRDVRDLSGDLDDAQIAGCVALRSIDADICEMKRLFVRETHRGKGLGRRLATEVVKAARSIGYSAMRLDTLNTMAAAIALYKSLGFVEIEPYYKNPIGCAVYMELAL